MDWAPFGKIGKTHGLKGELKLHSFFQDPDLCMAGCPVWLSGDDDENAASSPEFRVESIRGSSPIIKFKGYDSITAAKNLCGHIIFIPRIDIASISFFLAAK